eukprot:s2801_g15.t1
MSAAQDEIDQALALVQQGKRTLREARDKQHQVRMSRKYFRTSFKIPLNRDNSEKKIICLRCGQAGHKMANCPKSGGANASTATEESAPFMCYAEGSSQAETAEHGYLGEPAGPPPGTITTAEAVMQGKAVIDGGEGPLLFSIDSLRSLGAVLDFEHDLIVFRKLNANKVIALERSSTGHQLLPMTTDWYEHAQATDKPVECQVIRVLKLIKPLVLLVPLSLVSLLAWPAMPYVPKSELVKELEMMGETPPAKWTMLELKCRIQELRQERGFSAKSGKSVTQLKQLMIDLNKASRQKDQLRLFATQQLQISPERNHGPDPALVHQEDLHADRAGGRRPSGFRGAPRLAHWLELEKSTENDKSKIQPAKGASKTKTSKGSADSSGNMNANMAEMQNTIKMLQEELAALQEERPRKKVSAEEMSTDSFSVVSQRRGVGQEVLDLASKFECSVCKERQRPVPRPLATLEPQPPKWSVVAGDMGVWEHPGTGIKHSFLMLIDEGSRFRVGRLLGEGKKFHATAAQFLTTFQESWTQYFGYPNTLRLDPDGSFRSTHVEEFCDRHRIFLDVIPGEAHWKLSACEQAIKVRKRSRPVRAYYPGDLVYIWRKQVSGQSVQKGGAFIGPARVLAIETKKSPDGTEHLSSTAWCVRGRRLLKCSTEQLRHASERELILAELQSGHHEDWDFTRVASQLGGNEFLDLSQEIPTPEEKERASDPSQTWQPLKRCRGKRACPVSVDWDEPEHPTPGASSSRPHRSRSPAPAPGVDTPEPAGRCRRFLSPSSAALWAGQKWHEQDTVLEQCSFVDNSFWADSSAAVAVEIALPETRSSSERALQDLQAFFTNNLKKRSAVEIVEKHLTDEERQQFRSAKAVEVNNFISSKAFEAIPEHLKPSKDQAIRMRWILTWKYKDSGERKAKARAVLLGYQDPCYEQRSTNSPTTTRQTRQLQLQLSASLKFTMRKGDVTGAFLQSRPYPGELYCIPTPEICEGMGLPAESITKDLLQEVQCWQPDNSLEEIAARADAHLRQAQRTAVEALAQWSAFDAPQAWRLEIT